MCATYWYSELLRSGRSGVQILVEERFSAPVQIGPEAHPASLTMGTVSFLGRGVKRPSGGTHPPPRPPFRVKVVNGLELYMSPSSVPS
jgi:hypothetical protein